MAKKKTTIEKIQKKIEKLSEIRLKEEVIIDDIEELIHEEEELEEDEQDIDENTTAKKRF